MIRSHGKENEINDLFEENKRLKELNRKLMKDTGLQEVLNMLKESQLENKGEISLTFVYSENIDQWICEANRKHESDEDWEIFSFTKFNADKLKRAFALIKEEW